MYRIMIALAVVGACLAAQARAQNDAAPPPGDLKQVCQDGLTQASRGDAKGFALLWQHAIAPPATADELDAQARNQTQQLLAIQEQEGAFLGCELASEKQTGNTLRRYVYLAKYEKNVICWSFILYRPHDPWKILSYNYTDNAAAIELLFQELPLQATADAPANRSAPTK